MARLLNEIQFFRDLKILMRLKASRQSCLEEGTDSEPSAFCQPYEGFMSTSSIKAIAQELKKKGVVAARLQVNSIEMTKRVDACLRAYLIKAFGVG